MLASRSHPGEEALERSLALGIGVFRWATWLWMAVVLFVDARNHSLAHPVVAWFLVGLALAFTVWASVAISTRPALLHTPAAVITELAIAAALVGLDAWAYQSVHSQRLGSAWALAAILSAGVAFAGRGGFAAGLIIGIARSISIRSDSAVEWNGDQILSVASSLVLYSLAGAVAGFAAIKLREAEQEIAAARAREEVARTLHDGVLQTLAVIQRRSDDDELVELAREQERDLRRFLFGRSRDASGLEPALRQAIGEFERRYGVETEVVVATSLEGVGDTTTTALSGAVTEALTNASKHGGASRVTVFAEVVDDEAFCSVKDDGSGFDADDTDPGIGLSRSIRGRLEEVGGRAEIASRPGRGTEVRLWAPRRARRSGA